MNSFIKTFALLSVVGAGVSAFAVDQETFTFAGVLSYAAPDAPVVQTRTPAVTSYTLGKIRINASCTETVNTTGDFGTENKIRVTSPSGATTEYSPWTVTSYTGTLTAATLNSFFFQNQAIAGTWSYTFRNSVRDAPSGEADATIDATVVFTDETPTPPAATDLGALSDGQADYANADMSGNTSGAAVQWFKITTTNSFNPFTGRYLDFRVTGAATRAVGVYSASGDLLASTSTTSTTTALNLTFGSELIRTDGTVSHSWPATSAVRGLGAGTYYIAVCGTTASFGPVWTVSTTGTDTTPRTLEIRNNVAQTFSGSAPSNTDIGTINNPSNDYDTPDYNQTVALSGAAQWYKFTTTEAASGSKFIDIDTNETVSAIDSEIAIYDANGFCIAMSDDEGDGLSSQLSFGDTTPRLFTGSDGINAAGQNGTLPAGTYYVAVNRYSEGTGTQSRFGTLWAATGGSTTAGTAQLNIRTNLGSGGGGGGGISGTLDLLDYAPGEGGRSVNFEVAQMGNVVESATATLDLAGSFSFTTAQPDGSYDLLINAGRSWLTKKVSITISGGNATVGTVNVTNGDVNDDGIVDIADYSILSGSFDLFPGDPGYDSRADLNEDGFIDIADYSVLSSAFDLADDTP